MTGLTKMYLKNRACLVFFQCQVIVSHPGLNTKMVQEECERFKPVKDP